MKKLKVRLDAFSDAVIAIILTIMVLDLTPVMKDDWANYLVLCKELGVYLISYAFVANMWYQHSTLFNEIDDMSYRIMLYDFLFLILLSLTPLATNMMASNTTQVTVMGYGVLLAVVSFSFRLLARAIIHFQYTAASDMRQVYGKIFGEHNRIYTLFNFILIGLAYFFPHFVMWFYLPYPLVYLLLSSRDRQQMYDVAQLTPSQRADYLKLPRDKMAAFRKMIADQAAAKTSEATAQPGESASRPVLPWLDRVVGNGVETAAPRTPGGRIDVEQLRALRREQWATFLVQQKSQRAKGKNSQHADHHEQEDADKAAAQHLDLKKKAQKQADKEQERQQEIDEDTQEAARHDLARRQKLAQEAKEHEQKMAAKAAEQALELQKQQLRMDRRAQKARLKAQREEVKAQVRRAKIAREAGIPVEKSGQETSTSKEKEKSEHDQ
ncbi:MULTISPECIES: TMEM175 family protein [Lacticaseibacillus]|uniref:TMEM175 family protein n=2 Tax=Lacticaseibacillus TaxID=2759736 RepID=A0AAN1F0W4_LACCA|nr:MULTISPECIES: TMEM175 family protein [Lacticaseibacillus]ARY92773.1 hypothetical protein BGL52_13785 [Lacticaseibacillus casei]KAB1970202.1 DUF1211 domain-containing protein [Lacticaseibacillus casei]WLV80674.1 TMEM175 family protein [Lacticaseibacillus sp. NCIMB 15473]WNX24634.1 TMEM175 family protein [Lacticaseibacillus casei]WNX27406.1 TMEM175 family protein [Lacticaseibacillus casei]